MSILWVHYSSNIYFPTPKCILYDRCSTFCWNLSMPMVPQDVHNFQPDLSTIVNLSSSLHIFLRPKSCTISVESFIAENQYPSRPMLPNTLAYKFCPQQLPEQSKTRALADMIINESCLKINCASTTTRRGEKPPHRGGKSQDEFSISLVYTFHLGWSNVVK